MVYHKEFNYTNTKKKEELTIILTKAYKVNKPKYNFSYIQVVAFHLNSGFTNKIMEDSQPCFWHFSHKGNKLNEKLEGKKTQNCQS